MSLRWMALVTVGLVVGWGVFMEVTKALCFRHLKGKAWWPRCVRPQVAQMHNFGFPRSPTPLFPKGVTEPMAREMYGFMATICFQHGASALLMAPLVFGAKSAKTLFILGTLSDVAFDIYDTVTVSLRTWCPLLARRLGYEAVPRAMWFLLCVLHHPLAMAMVLPMNLKYADVPDYHHICFSLLAAASVCYAVRSFFSTSFVTNVFLEIDGPLQVHIGRVDEAGLLQVQDGRGLPASYRNFHADLHLVSGRISPPRALQGAKRHTLSTRGRPPRPRHEPLQHDPRLRRPLGRRQVAPEIAPDKRRLKTRPTKRHGNARPRSHAQGERNKPQIRRQRPHQSLEKKATLIRFQRSSTHHQETTTTTTTTTLRGRRQQKQARLTAFSFRISLSSVASSFLFVNKQQMCLMSYR